MTNTTPASTLSPLDHSPLDHSPLDHSPLDHSPLDAARLEIGLKPGLAAEQIDGHLRRAAKGHDICNRILAFYLDELDQSEKHRDLGYTCLAKYADSRLGIDERRARELAAAGRALLTLTRVDQACIDGRLDWTHTLYLTQHIQPHEQDEWVERAENLSCRKLKRSLVRHSKGQRVDEGGNSDEGSEKGSGLPRSEFEFSAPATSARHDRIEEIRAHLMRTRGRIVDDGEVLAELVDGYKLPEYDAEAAAERAAACEQDATPAWLRNKVFARDGFECRLCGEDGVKLHAHHIVFKSLGGKTVEENLTSACRGCHGLVHEGRLFVSGTAPDDLHVCDRFGQPRVRAGHTGTTVPDVMLRVYQKAESDDGNDDRGGRPPRENPAEISAEIPAQVTAEWFKANIDLFEQDRRGVFRPRKAPRG